jgi:membrane fusion protein (multidrug efflux system)
MTSLFRPLLPIACLLVTLTACSGDENVAAGKPPPVTVTTAEVALKPWTDRIEALGTAQANESVMVTAKVTETVVRVNFEDGDLAQAGQVLVDLSGRAEVAGLEEAAAAFRESEQQYRRQQQLTEQKLVPASQLDTQRAAYESAKARLDATRARLSDRVITAPFSGLLGFRRVSPGTLVTPGTTITSLDDISIIKLEFSVPENYLAALSPGQKISAHSAAYPDRIFSGSVRTIDSRVDPVTRAVRVRAEIRNDDRALRPGMLLTLGVEQPERQALVVPEISIVQVARDAYVFRVAAGDTVERVPVRLGLRRAGEVEVLEGLAAGDRVVVDGTGKLRPGAGIKDVGTRPPAPAAAEAEAATKVG